MPRKFEVPKGVPLLDIVSSARGGPRGAHLSGAQLEKIQRTVRRVSEVMVKVLPRGSSDFKAAGKHLDYIGRKGELELETDDGQGLQGRVGKSLLEDWDLDIDDCRPQASLGSGLAPRPKLIHKLMFSMPPGTPPQKVLQAVRNLAREEFGLKHRYALVLHVDEPHPHVHLVLKAMSESGVRLNIRKETLRIWRAQFAQQLRLLGVQANATDRELRGLKPRHVGDGLYRTTRRMINGRSDSSLDRVLSTTHRSNALRASQERWVRIAQVLADSGYMELGSAASAFAAELGRPSGNPDVVRSAPLLSRET